MFRKDKTVSFCWLEEVYDVLEKKQCITLEKNGISPMKHRQTYNWKYMTRSYRGPLSIICINMTI